MKTMFHSFCVMLEKNRSTEGFCHFIFLHNSQWQIQGRGPGGPGPHLIFFRNSACFFEVQKFSSLDSTFIVNRALSLAEGLDPPLIR